MKVLVVGGGAREHALAWKLSQSEKVSELYVAPGNAGTSVIATNLGVSATDIDGLCKAAREKTIGLAVVGPEAPLAGGLVDRLEALGIPAFGPRKDAALIETSKVFAKELMHRHGIPCGGDRVFTDFEAARKYTEGLQPPLVVKADGLAAGKGVIVAESRDDALKALSDMMQAKVFGGAGDRVIVEECLVGRETSLLAFTDGESVIPLIPARDYKRAHDGDAGPNTGGMGAYAPPPFLTPDLRDEIVRTILKPVVRALNEEGRDYRGVVYAGIMLTSEGPKVLEFNARFGDPETQVQLPMLKTDLVEIMMATIEGGLDKTDVEWKDGACVGVVLASGGYPGKYRDGLPVSGLTDLDEDVAVFHAGTKKTDGEIVTSGGRVATVVASGSSVAEAREKAYANVRRIRFEGCHYRTDIAAEEA